VLNCTEPSITYSKGPANFTSKYHTAPEFVSKECKVTKTFGEESEKVLFVFDGTQAPDMNALIAKVRPPG
jgi:threonine aldolase